MELRLRLDMAAPSSHVRRGQALRHAKSSGGPALQNSFGKSVIQKLSFRVG
jgi:hypothetical protein